MAESSTGLRRGFRIGPWSVEPLRGAVIAPDGEIRRVEPKVMDVLVRLAERAGEISTRQELLDAIWSRHVAADQQLTRAISELRRVLGDDPRAPRFIETVPKRGYRLLARVSALEDEQSRTGSSLLTRHRKTLAAAALLTAAIAILVVGFEERMPPLPVSNVRSATEALAIPFDKSETSIAVLPFANLSADPDDVYLSEGLAEKIRNLLAGVPTLKVIGRRSSSAFAQAGDDYRAIARQLGVGRLLEGSVQKVNDRLRIGVQLIDASDGSLIWSESFDRSVLDVFALQEAVAIAVLAEMEVHVSDYPTRGRPTDDADAYGLYLKARQSLNVQDRLPAEISLMQAVALDPQFAEAWELLAFTYWVEPRPERDWGETVRLIREAAANSLAIDGSRPFARALYYESNSDLASLPQAIEAYVLAARLQPSDPSILRVLSWHLVMTGYLDLALDVSTRMVEIDPFSSMSHIRQFVSLNALGRYSEARASLETAHHLDPSGLAWYLGEFHLALGNDEQAIAWFEQDLEQRGIEPVDWVRNLIIEGRRADTGVHALDSGVAALSDVLPTITLDELSPPLESWHLFLGHLDRYVEIIFENFPSSHESTRTEMDVYYGMMNRNLGFTAHPDYIEIAKRMGHDKVWEQLGAPDHCRKAENGWQCE